MTEPVTPNKGFTVPNTGDLLNAWGGPINTNFTNIDTALAGLQSIALTSGGTVTMTAAQAQFLATNLTGALSANSIFQVPQVGGFYLLNNAAIGTHTTVSCQTGAAGGATVSLFAGWNIVFTDGTNVYLAPQSIAGNAANATTATQVKGNVYDSAGNLIISSTAPTIASGFGTSPSILANNTGAFQITIGTGGTSYTGIINMPTAPNGWACTAQNVSSSLNRVRQFGVSATTVTLDQFTTAGANAPFSPGDVIVCQCTAF